METAKEVEEALMPFVEKETKHITDEPGQTMQRWFPTNRCPKQGFCTGMITFRDKSGIQNTYAHLKSY